MSRESERELLVALQRGLPLERRPFAALGQRLGLDESAVLRFARELRRSGRARRFGAVFDVRRLGYRSALCAVAAPESELARAIGVIVPLRGVTHCYRRGWPRELDPQGRFGPGDAPAPNLWFTLAELNERFDAVVRRLDADLAPLAPMWLPAVRRFKIDVVFDPASRDRGEIFPGRARAGGAPADDEPLRRFDEREKSLVRALQGDLPTDSLPFDGAAQQLGLPVADLLAALRGWQAAGVLRRVGFVLRHRRAGFRANGMCVWRVDEDRVPEAGRRLAARDFVTHCYQRIMLPAFPFNLYAMIHGADWATALDAAESLSDAAGLDGGRVLFSLEEYKKISPRYFAESEEQR